MNTNINIKDICSIQPMNLPKATVFYMDFKYGEPKRISWWKQWFNKLFRKKSKIRCGCLIDDKS